MGISETLHRYLHKLTRLNRAPTVYGKAPHKPVLLISIIDLFEKGMITANRIFVNTELVATFRENWDLLVNTAHQSDFTQPFYYLQSERVEGEQIWFLQPRIGCQINTHIKSVIRLSQVLEYAFLSPDLYLLLSNSVTRNMIKTSLIDTYFPSTKNQYVQSKEKGAGYIHDMEAYLLNEPEVQYKKVRIETEEDVFVRGGLFKKLVPKLYDSTCSFTGMRVES
jgi:putative restriction endonuclease